LAVALFMIIGLLIFLAWQGGSTFWPRPVVEVRTVDGRTYVGEIAREEWYTPRDEEIEILPASARSAARERLAAQGGKSLRRLIRTGNFDLTGNQYQWVSDFQEEGGRADPWALSVERTEGGNAYGYLDGLVLVRDPKEKDPGKGEVLTGDPTEAWTKFNELQRMPNLGAGPDRYYLRLKTISGTKEEPLHVPVQNVVRAYPANQLNNRDKWGVYFGRWTEFVFAQPRNANTEGGVWPAILGTVTMTLLMTLLVVPFGVLAAVYLREYAKSGPVVSAVRIAINNLAGVPSIVYGIFGPGFFCYFVGGGVDRAFFDDNLPTPTFGTGGVLWAALTLALLTLPVVIVSTEEALAAVPNSMREGSYACGASKWQTIYRIVLPRAMPGIMTGTILAMARGAGEVAPLMLVGAVNKASGNLMDGDFPYFHAERSFLHLGLHIYDVGFQSPNSEASRPMVFTTTLLLIVVVALLNLVAVWLRARLRKRFHVTQF